jgi:hypothetical protein
MSLIAARTGIHGRNQLKACREVGLSGCSGDADATGFQGLPQCFQNTAVKFGKLIEKQHAAMG